MRVRKFMATVLAVGVACSIAACQQPTPEPHPLPKGANPPVILEAGQIERILGSLAEEIQLAVEQASVEPMATRVDGPALQMLQAQYAAKAADPDSKLPFELDWGFKDEKIVTTSDTWPRSFVAVTESKAAQAPYLYRIEQADPRSPYKLVSWARMLAGAKMPPTVQDEMGSMPVDDTEASGLAMTPSEALAAYAAAKTDPAGESAQLFDTALAGGGTDRDPVRANWTTTYESMARITITMPGGKANQSAEVVEGSAFAVSTADSGALVFGQISSAIDLSFTPTAGYAMNLSPKGYTALGATTLAATQSAHIEHLQTVVLAVPPAGSDTPIQVLAVAGLPVAVTVK